MLAKANKDKKQAISKIQSDIEGLLMLRSSGDVRRALAAAEDVLRTADAAGSGNVLSTTMQKALRDVIKQDALVDKRRQIAERLDTASVPATLPRTSEDKQELEAVLVECELGDTNLERKIRQALMLPLPAGTVEPSKEFFTPVYVTGSRKLSDLVGASAKGSNLSSRPVGSAPVRSKKTASLRSGSAGAVVKYADSNRSDMPAEMKAGTAAAKLRAMAQDKALASWAKFQEEFGVQQLVWQSVILTKTKANDRSAFQAQIEGVKARIDDIMSMKSTSMDNALLALEQLLPQNGEPTDVLNKSTLGAGNDVLKQHRLAAPRNELAERLASAHIPATLPRGAADKKALEALVESCEVEEPQLARAVRQVLLLPIPAHLGAPVTAKKTHSTRSSSTGAIGAKLSRNGSEVHSFQPPSRGEPLSRIKESI